MDFQVGWSGKIVRICEWIYRLAYLNLLWLLFILIGFIFMGLGPSTQAMYAIMRKWINGEEDFSIFRTFLSFYKSDFKQANVIGLVLVTVGVFILIDLNLLNSFDGAVKYFLLASFTTVFILYLLVMLYIFPIAVHYKNTTLQHFKSALIIGVSFPFRTFIMCTSVICVLFICLIFPAISLLYLGSGLCFITMFFSRHVFTKISQQSITVLID